MRASRTWGLAAASLLLITPALAQAQAQPASTSASRLSLGNGLAQPIRASARTEGESKLAGGAGWIIGAIGLIAGVTYAFVEGNDDNPPEVPVSN